jgi:uncharacterized pyridoxal phosphate-containing UPF0001 family protein
VDKRGECTLENEAFFSYRRAQITGRQAGIITFMSIATRTAELEANLTQVEGRISVALAQTGRERSEITLICVTKNFPASDANLLAALGQRNFGKNRDREGREKSESVKGIWHFQGQIQSNKIKSIAEWADVVHSIDSKEQIESFGWRRPKDRPLGVFLQALTRWE